MLRLIFSLVPLASTLPAAAAPGGGNLLDVRGSQLVPNAVILGSGTGGRSGRVPFVMKEGQVYRDEQPQTDHYRH